MIDQHINAWVLKQVRTLMRAYHHARADAPGRAFFCNALNGTSDYNISVNCDMTVSCSCADHDGSGTIGDLSTHSLQEIFDGQRARGFRSSLARGRLPILQCATCPELRIASREEARRREREYHTPTEGIMVENTIRCNYNCRSCTRALITKQRSQKSLSLDDVGRVSRTIRECGIKSLYYHKLGEAFLSPAIYEEIKTIREDNPGLEIKIETNGSAIDTDQKRAAAMMMHRVRVSIDGNNTRVLRRYQRGGSFHKAYQNIKDLVAYRNARGQSLPVIEWKYVVFNWNDRERMLAEVIERAREAGVNGISFWPTVSPFYGFSPRYFLRLYSDRIRSYSIDDFFVKLR
ncbi:MAG: radical SAM protein [Chitinivibrionales bacterium]|nr:radical SAM protein [Chitinivibrionales bacterium]MBD3395908.1 radical SAM protein [Chitinivibrionales bacterium]